MKMTILNIYKLSHTHFHSTKKKENFVIWKFSKRLSQRDDFKMDMGHGGG